MVHSSAKRRSNSRRTSALFPATLFNRKAALMLATGALLLAGHPASADTVWQLGSTGTTGGGTGNWNVAGNWSNGLPDTGTQNAVINNGGTVLITTNQASFDCNTGTVNNGSGTYTMSGATTTLTVNSWFRQGVNTGSSGIFNLNGGTVSNSTTQGGSNVNLGENGTGTLNVAGGTFNNNNNNVLQFGTGTSGVGFLNISSGAFNQQATSILSLGTNGTGTINLSGGNFNNNSSGLATIGTNAGANGTFNITGGTYTGVAASTMNIGYNGTGKMNISSGAFNTSATTLTSLGTNAAGVGNMTISGTGVYSSTGTGVMDIGNAGKGTLNMQAGTFTNTGVVAMGVVNGASGTMNISGGTMNFNATGTGSLQVGEDNAGTGTTTGTVTQTGGAVTTAGELWIGQNTGSTGVYSISAGTLNTASWIAVGRASSTGTLNISGTGTVTKTSNNGNITVAGIGTAQTGTINQNSGTLTNTLSQTWIGETANGIYNMSGGTATLGALFVDYGGVTGILNMQGATGATGTLTNGGGGETLTAGIVTLGNSGTGTGTVNLAGGILVANQIIGGGSSGAKTVNFNGGLLTSGAASTTFVSGVTTNVLTGGAKINTNGFADTILTVLVGSAGDGGLTLNDTAATPGTLTLMAANTYTGATTITAGTLQLGNGTTGNDSTLMSTSIVDNSTLIYNRFNSTPGALTFSGVVSGSGSVTKTGAGSQTLSAANTYTGATTVSGGTLILNHSGANTGALGNTAVSVGGGATLTAKGTTAIGNAAGGTLSLVGGATAATQGTLSLQDTTVNTLTTGGNVTFGTGANGSIFNVDLGNANGSSDTLNVGGTATANGTTTINLNALTSIASGTTNYTLINATGGGLTAGGAGFTIGTKPAGFNQYSLANSTTTQEILTINANATTVGNEFWTGAASLANGDTANNWGFGATLGTPASNWSTDQAGMMDPKQVPGATTDVVFTANNATPSAGTTLTTQLDAGYSLDSLTFNVPSATTITSSIINTNGNMLTIGNGQLGGQSLADSLSVAAGSNSAGTINGTGSVVLNGSQTWGNNSALGLTVSTSITGNAATSTTNTLTFNGSGTGNTTLGGVISNGSLGGTLGLIVSKTNTGILALNGANTFTGGDTLNSGTVKLGNATALGAATNVLTFGAGSTSDLQLNGNGPTVGGLNTNATVGTPIIENASATGATLTDNDTTSDAYGGVIQDGTGGGALTLTKTGGNLTNLTLSGANTFTGAVNIANGSLTITNSNGLGTGTKTININNGTNGNDSLILDNGGGANANISLGSNLSFSTSNIGGTNPNSVTGTVTANTGTITNNNGNNTIAGAFSFTTGGGGTNFTVNGGSLTLTGNETPVNNTISQRGLILQGANNGAISGNVADVTGATANGNGSIAVTKNGAGLWNLSGVNAYTGATAVTAGTLQAGSATAFGTNSAVTMTNAAGATLDLNSFNETIGALAGGGTLGGNVTMGSGNLTVGQGTTASTFGGVISGTGNLTQTGTSGTLTLTNADTYSGSTTISGGTLQLGTGATGLDGSLPNTTSLADNGVGVIYNIFGNQTAAYNITGTGTLTKQGAGTLTLTGNNSYAGSTTLNGATLNVGSAGAIGTAGTLNFTGGTLQYSAANQTDYSGRFSQAAGQFYNIDTNGQNVSFATGLTSTGASTLHKFGAGTLTLNGATYSVQDYFGSGGTTVLSTGTTLNTTGYSSIGQAGTDNSTLTLNGAASFLVSGDFNVSDLSGSNGVLNINSTATVKGITTYIGKSGTATGTVNQMGGTYTQTGGGDFRIGGAGSAADVAATGTYNLSGGTLNTGGNFQVGAFGKGTLTQTGGTVNSPGYTDSGRFAGSVGLIDVEGGTFNQSNASTKLFAGEQGTGTITVGGTGTIVSKGGVTEANDTAGQGTVNLNGGTLNTAYVVKGTGSGGGVLNLNGGTLQANAASTTFLTGVTTNVLAGGAILDTNTFNDTATVAFLHAGTGVDGGFTKNGTGTLTLTNAGNTFTGPTVVNAGTLALTGALNAGAKLNTSSSVTINNGGTISVVGDNNYLSSIPGSIVTTINTGGTLTEGDNATTVHLGPLALAGGTLASNATAPTGDALTYGTWNLDKGVTAGGTTSTSTISANNLALTQTGGTTFNVASGATNGPDLLVSGTIGQPTGVTNTALIKTGAGTLTLSNTNTYTSGTTVNGGTLVLAHSGADGSGTLTVNSSGTVTVTAAQGDSSTDPIINGGTYNVAVSGALGSPTTIENGGKLVNTDLTANDPTTPHTTSNDTQIGGVLTIGNGTNILDFGAGNTGAIFDFADSSAATWTGTLSVYDWSGGYPTSYDPTTQRGTTGGDGLDQLFFGSDGTANHGLTLSQLQDITFYSDAGTTKLGNGVSIILQDGEVSPAPEPAEVATLSMIGLGLGGLLLRARKRLAAVASKVTAK